MCLDRPEQPGSQSNQGEDWRSHLSQLDDVPPAVRGWPDTKTKMPSLSLHTHLYSNPHVQADSKDFSWCAIGWMLCGFFRWAMEFVIYILQNCTPGVQDCCPIHFGEAVDLAAHVGINRQSPTPGQCKIQAAHPSIASVFSWAWSKTPGRPNTAQGL